MRVSDLFTARSIAVNRSEVESNRIPFLGEQFFPNAKKMGIDLKWIKSHKGLGVALAPANFDALATIRPREGFAMTSEEMPLFRESMIVKERDMIEIMRIQESSDPYAMSVLADIYDDTNTLIDGADISAERMRMQLLAAEGGTPKITITGKDNMTYAYNYDADGTWAASHYLEIQTPADKWNVATSKPLTNIRTAVKALAAAGYTAKYALMNSTTFDYLLSSTQVLNALVTITGQAVSYVDDEAVSEVFRRKTGLTPLIYDKQFKDYDGTAKQFYPDNYVTIIGEDTLGNTWYGTTPEERTLLGDAKADVAVLDRGVAVAVKTDYGPPVLTSTTVSQIVLPSFEMMDAIYVMKVV